MSNSSSTHGSAPRQLLVTSYGDGGFRVGDRRVEGSVVLGGGEVKVWPVTSLDQLTVASLSGVFSADTSDNGLQMPEILLIGTGKSFGLLPVAIRQWAEEIGISADSMDTGAAARTYNVLCQENRSVAAALIAV